MQEALEERSAHLVRFDLGADRAAVFSDGTLVKLGFLGCYQADPAQWTVNGGYPPRCG